MSVRSVRRERDSGDLEASRLPGTLAKRLFGQGRSALLFTLIALVGGLHALLLVGLEVNRLIYTEREIGRLELEIAAFTQEADELRDVLLHRTDLDFREQLARTHGFVYPDELRVVTRAGSRAESAALEPGAPNATHP